MADIPSRDITGKCEGECKDQVAELEKKQQEKINKAGVEFSTAKTPSVNSAWYRNDAPGSMGGHV
nr:hypothetical protein [uncultured Desulfobacter sp.]